MSNFPDHLAGRVVSGARGCVALVLGWLVVSVAGAAIPQDARAASDATPPPAQEWTWAGIRGGFDRQQLQRGYQVYTEVCAACHAMNYLYYRDLLALGYSPEQVKAIAADAIVVDGPNDEGEEYERPALPSDRFVRPFPNDLAAAAANNGAVPKDLSLIAKARANGPDYLYALLALGYSGDKPAELQLGDGQYYNGYFPGEVISMAPPLSEDQVSYADGTPATVGQMSADVTAFMAWAAEPTMELRKRIGLRVVLFLFALSVLSWFAMNLVWRDVKGKKKA